MLLILTLLDWRYGLVSIIVVGFIQDPLRKLMIGEPAYITLLAGVFLVVLLASLLIRNHVPSIIRDPEVKRYLYYPLISLLILLIVQLLNSFVRHETLLVPLIGSLAYLFPLIALAVGREISNINPTQILKFIKVYILTYSIFVLFLYAEYYGFEHRVLGEIGEGIIIYDLGTAFRGFTGLMRSPDIAAWHAASAVMFIAILVVCKQHRSNAFMIALLLLVIGAGILTGRRKFIAELLVFSITYWFLLSYFQKESKKILVLAVSVFVVGYFILQQIIYINDEERFVNIYLERGKTVFQDIPDRFKVLGLESVIWAYNRVGLVGAGLGASTPSARHFTQDQISYGGAGEGGFGKIMLELGVMGLLILGWFSWSLFSYCWKSLEFVTQVNLTLARLSYGLVAYLIANISTFVIATQVFNDLYVLLIISLITGFLISIRTIGYKMLRENK